MADKTTFMKITSPSESEDPFWNSWQAFVNSIDYSLYMQKVKTNFILCCGGTVAFDDTTGILTWTEDFKIPFFETGYKLVIKYGPDGATRQATLQDGEALVLLDIPSALSEDREMNLSVTNQLTPSSVNQYIIGHRIGNQFFMRRGESIV